MSQHSRRIEERARTFVGHAASVPCVPIGTKLSTTHASPTSALLELHDICPVDLPPPPSVDRLNLATDGSKLNYKKAMNDPSRVERFKIAGADEYRKLIRERGCMHPIYPHELPNERRHDPTYYNPQTKEKMLVDDVCQARVRGTAGGNLIHYEGDVATHSAAMTTLKTLINSTASTVGARLMTLDIKDYYINHDLERPEYLRIPLSAIPDEIRQEFDLDKYADREGNVLFEVTKAIYGLPQSGIVSEVVTIEVLKAGGFHQCLHTQGLFAHASLPSIKFALVVDDFIVRKQDAEHLIEVLEKKYVLSKDREGRKYLGFNIQQDPSGTQITMDMPTKILAILLRFDRLIQKFASSNSLHL